MPTRHCHQCGREYQLPGQPGRSESCACGAELHVCRNCLNYDPKAAEQCRDRRAEEVLEKDRANFCEYFEMVRRAWQPPQKPEVSREDAARARLQQLLGD